jgi:carbonic anhydrase
MPERDAAIQRLLTANAQWAQDVTKLEPNFFEQSAKGQSPHVRCLSSDYQRRRR